MPDLTPEDEAMMRGLTTAQRKLIADMGCFFAALREPEDFLNDGVVFSELVNIVVHPKSGRFEDRYRIRNKTAGPLYLQTPPLVNCVPGDSGYRQFHLTPAGLRIRHHLQQQEQQP